MRATLRGKEILFNNESKRELRIKLVEKYGKKVKAGE
jgi:hypothetical protein